MLLFKILHLLRSCSLTQTRPASMQGEITQINQLSQINKVILKATRRTY